MNFDTKKFILEMEKRPTIWDPTCEDYGDREVRKKTWIEITKVMCGDNLTAKQKNEFCKSLQHKWKNIRTSFTRELRRRSGSKGGSVSMRKSPYVYFDILHFLGTVVDNNSTNSTSVERITPTVEIRNKIESIDIKYETIDNNVIEDESESVEIRPPSPKRRKVTEDESLVERSNEGVPPRVECERYQESDSDKMFLLSLLEDFKGIPKHRKLTTKMEIINVINRAQTLPMETPHSDLGMFRQDYTGYQSGTNNGVRENYYNNQTE